MPFQDVDEVSSEPVRTPSGAEKLVRKVFVEDWSLKLLSLAIAVVLWLAVTAQNEPVTTHVSMQLNFVRPQSLDISNDPPKSVDVRLTGSRSKLDRLSAPDLVITIDITDLRAGERVLRLSEKAQISLPQGVKVEGFLPGVITVRLEPIVERQLEIAPKVEGRTAEGYEIYLIKADPNTVTVRGPESHVKAIEKALTETIWLAGQKDSFDASSVAIDISDPKVALLDPDVNVRIEIGETRVEKNFTDVQVVTQAGKKAEPQTASVSLLGPSSLINVLKKEDIKLVFDGNESVGPRLDLPAAFQGKVILKSSKPTKFQSQ